MCCNLREISGFQDADVENSGLVGDPFKQRVICRTRRFEGIQQLHLQGLIRPMGNRSGPFLQDNARKKKTLRDHHIDLSNESS